MTLVVNMDCREVRFCPQSLTTVFFIDRFVIKKQALCLGIGQGLNITLALIRFRSRYNPQKLYSRNGGSIFTAE